MFKIFFTPRCPFCLKYQNDDNVCTQCFSKIEFLSLACSKCQEPFQYEVPGVDTCSKCLAKDRDLVFYDKMYCALKYNEHVKNLILSFKNHKNFGLRELFAKYMISKVQLYAPNLLQNVILVPVPLYKKRLIERGYNQSLILAHAIKKLVPGASVVNALKRVRNTNSQALKTIKQREENVKNAFVIDLRYLKYLNNKNVILVDDVVTTGATAFECAKMLSKYSKNVNILALARRTRI